MTGKFTNLSGGGLLGKRHEEEDDPMSSLANLSDCMLVLACGLMIALVVAWNIDISNVTEMEITDNAKEVTNVENITDAMGSDGSSYVDMGRIYQDPETGKYYMVTEEDKGK